LTIELTKQKILALAYAKETDVMTVKDDAHEGIHTTEDHASRPCPPAPSESPYTRSTLGQEILSPSKLKIAHIDSDAPSSSSLLGGSPRLSPENLPSDLIFSEILPKQEERTPSPVKTASSSGDSSKNDSHVTLEVSYLSCFIPV
jgi:hypothetical protein